MENRVSQFVNVGETEKYFIKPGYRCNVIPGQEVMFGGQQDSVENSTVCQYEVYEHARRLIKEHKLKSVLDIGCGCAMKLKKLILPVCQDITGIDEASTISWCKQHHDFGIWYADNLEDTKVDLGGTFDLIISADVIEHLVNPDKLLEMIKGFASRDTFIMLSTPERDATRGKDDMGPPSNSLHAREWSFDEFKDYIEQRGFRVIKHSRVEASTPLQFQNGRLRYIKKVVKWSLPIVSSWSRPLLSGQLLLLKISDR